MNKTTLKEKIISFAIYGSVTLQMTLVDMFDHLCSQLLFQLCSELVY
jgi:hypothetical protein